uniref:Kanadaptin (inferred by orthology to a human protein) n=1 Tax=Strongyloides venezuelensis TaxID=75913 RepID=A0A0K0F7C3_STRVS
MSGSSNNFVVPSLPSHSSNNEDPCSSEENKTLTKITSNYNPPEWCNDIPSDSPYYLDIIKNGIIVETIKLNKSKNITYFTIGRLPENDIVMLHPSISRVHGIIQYGNGSDGIGYYIMDNDSAHKTKLNRNVLDPRKFIKLRNGFNIQLGGSTRFIVFNGPDEEQERENERHVIEYNMLMEKRKLQKNIKVSDPSLEPQFNYDSYNSRDNYGEETDDTSIDANTDQAEEFWNAMARRRKKRKNDDSDDESFWDETKSIDDIRKKKVEEEAFIESLKVKHKKNKEVDHPCEEIETRINELEKNIVDEKKKIDKILKEHKMEDNESSVSDLLFGKVKLPKKQGLTVPINNAKKMQLTLSMKNLQSLETELKDLKKIKNSIYSEGEISNLPTFENS